MSGKGSGRRRAQVPEALIAEQWDRLFGKKTSNGPSEYERLRKLKDEFKKQQVS